MSQGFTKGIPIATDPTMVLNSDLVVPSQAAVVAYVANEIANSGAVTSVTATAPIASTGGTAPNLSMPQASLIQDGYLDSADFSTFSGKQDSISLTNIGTTGLATFIANILNIPQYQGQITLTTTGTTGPATLNTTTNTLNVPQYGGGGVTTNDAIAYAIALG